MATSWKPGQTCRYEGEWANVSYAMGNGLVIITLDDVIHVARRPFRYRRSPTRWCTSPVSGPVITTAGIPTSGRRLVDALSRPLRWDEGQGRQVSRMPEDGAADGQVLRLLRRGDQGTAGER